MGFWSWLFGSSKKSGGTRIEQLQVLDVIDGDTIRIDLRGEKETLRFCCVDTEESQGNSGKPITNAGKMASKMAKEYFRQGDGFCAVDIEFDTDDLEEVCLVKHRDTYGRLICYVHKHKENFNFKLIEEGWSPYFDKYGFSRLYHTDFVKAQADARGSQLVIWNPETNEGGPARDYDALLPWWNKRGKRVQRFRERGKPNGALDVREDYPEIIEAIDKGKELAVFCDLQRGISTRSGEGAALYVGTETQPFSLWIPNATSDAGKKIVSLIENTYARRGFGFAYIVGEITTYKEKPQIVITDIDQIQDSKD